MPQYERKSSVGRPWDRDAIILWVAMPEFHAVQCCQCSTYQVQQVKKVAKFSCRLCGTKQSVKQVHAVSCKASDVRPVVMELNAKRQALDEAEEQPVQPEIGHEPAAQPEEDNVAWQEYNEVDEIHPEVSGAQQNPEGAYTTEAPGDLKKAIKAQKATRQGSRDLWGDRRHNHRYYRENFGSGQVCHTQAGRTRDPLKARNVRMRTLEALSPPDKSASARKQQQAQQPTQQQPGKPAGEEDQCSMPLFEAVVCAPDSSAGVRGEGIPAAASQPQRPRSMAAPASAGASRPSRLSSHTNAQPGPGVRGAAGSAAHAEPSGHSAMPSPVWGTKQSTAQHQPSVPSTGALNGVGAPVWEAFMDDVDELECDPTPAKQRQASAEAAVGGGCFVTS